MALKLTILSEQRVALGTRGSIVFGVGGGSIGRAHDNDWVLPDPERYLSAHHARVKFHDGAFYLTDTSTNGVYVNERNEALGRRASHALRNGDRLRLGDYEIGVSMDAASGDDTAEAPEASDVFPLTPGTPGSEGAPAPADLGASFNMRDLLRADPIDAKRAAPTDDPALLAFDQSGPRRAAAAQPQPAAAQPQPAAPARLETRAETRAAEGTTGIEAFCRGAGIDAKAFAEDTHARLLNLAGLMMREALVGLKGLALAQREMRAQHQIEVGREDPQRIGLAGLPVEDLLLRLLQGHGEHRLDAVQWLRETLASTRQHDLAVARALRAALVEFIARLDPKALAGGARASGEVDLAMLRERYLSIAEMPTGRLPHLFIEAFARVFAAEFKSSGS